MVCGPRVRGGGLPAPESEGWMAEPGRARPQQARVRDGIDPEQRSLGHAHAAGHQGTVAKKDVRVECDRADRHRPAMHACPAEIDAVGAERVIADVDRSGERVDKAADFAVASYARAGEPEPVWPQKCAVEPALRRIDEGRYEPERHLGGAPTAHNSLAITTQDTTGDRF